MTTSAQGPSRQQSNMEDQGGDVPSYMNPKTFGRINSSADFFQASNDKKGPRPPGPNGADENVVYEVPAAEYSLHDHGKKLLQLEHWFLGMVYDFGEEAKEGLEGYINKLRVVSQCFTETINQVCCDPLKNVLAREWNYFIDFTEDLLNRLRITEEKLEEKKLECSDLKGEVARLEQRVRDLESERESNEDRFKQMEFHSEQCMREYERMNRFFEPYGRVFEELERKGLSKHKIKTEDELQDLQNPANESIILAEEMRRMADKMEMASSGVEDALEKIEMMMEASRIDKNDTIDLAE